MRSLLSISATNFLSLGRVNVELQDLTVLLGPNGVGKSNLLKVIQFLGDTARLDLLPAIDLHGGFDEIYFRGADSKKQPRISLGITGLITGFSSENAPDEYTLEIWRFTPTNSNGYTVIRRREDFAFKRTQGRGRRITVSGNKVEVSQARRASASTSNSAQKTISLATTSSGLSTLPRLGKEDGGEQINLLAELFTTFRVFEIDTAKARRPSRYDPEDASKLDSDAGNLASFLYWLKTTHEQVFDLLVEDLQYIAPSIKGIRFHKIGGADSYFAVELIERGLKGPTTLASASFGTIRAIALLAMLHDPNPPKLTCVEEIDHGLHPHALDRIVERMRSAAKRTQLLVVSHSPALANRLSPHEIVVCERDYDKGSSNIPAISAEEVAQMSKESGLLPGELWFSGALGGVL